METLSLSNRITPSMKIFELITEIIGWIKIMLSPTLVGIILGAIIFGKLRNTTGLVLGIIVAAIGLVVGIIWATRIFRSKKGTISFLSRIDATPELDNHDPDK